MAVTVDDLREMLRISAQLVEDFGEVALPLFERCERELAEAEKRSSSLDRARAIAQSAAKKSATK